MRSFGPRDYRPLHLEAGLTGKRAMRPTRTLRLNPASPIALLFASLVVTAHSDARAAGRTDERGGDRPFVRPAVDAATADDCVPALWRRAVAGARTDELGRLLAVCPDAGFVEEAAPDGRTALMVAAKADDVPLARALIRAGARLDRATAMGGTALMFCALGARLDVARALHAAGARVDVPAENGWTALTIAAARGRLPLVDWLLSVGAPPAPIDVYGFTPLMRAVENGHVAAVARLLAASPDTIDHGDELGNTALHHAVGQELEPMVRLLVAAGADPDAPNRDGLTPRALATGSDALAEALDGA